MGYFVVNFIHKFVSFFKVVLIAALTQLGLLKQQQQGYIDTDDPEDDETNNYILLFDRPCPIPVPVSVKILTTLIKQNLVVREFCSIIEKLGEDEECMCCVCLDSVKHTDEIRELCNCYHVFHKECLDTWVDKGHISCPLCRSMLFPDDILAAERRALFE